ncbi:MAG: hypothetical protein LBT54_05045, partial [Bifidobacteriaceae bacterium]|nr:hypothetical protein [Bifidobacteriaceae bacterium]
MSEDSKTASPRPAASGAAYRIAAIAVAVVAVAAIVVSLVVATPRLGEASKTRNLVELLEKVELAQRAVATELNDIRLEYLTNKSPDEKQTDDAIAALNAAADAVGVGSLDLPEDQPGARPRALLTDGPEQLAQARESLSGHTTDQDFVDHEQLLRDGWLVANAIPPALEPLDAAAATAAKEFVESAESVPVPLIEPQAQGEDQRLDQLEAMAAPFEDDSSSAKTFSYLLYGVSAVLVLAAAALYWLALRSRRRPA